MHTIEIDRFLRQPKTIFSEPSSIQAHQSSKTRPDNFITFASFLGDKTTMYSMLPSRKREQNIRHVLILWFRILSSKREKLPFTISFISQSSPYSKNFAWTRLSWCENIDNLGLCYTFFVEKFVSFYLGLTNA